jgi:1-phosphatidylinositol-4-phosphate 5-kinase
MGIIDTLTNYGGAKKGENFVKSIFQNSKTISCIPPKDYGNRFYNFMKDEVFK